MSREPDVVVVGAGPAGLAATREMAGAGLSVLVIDEQAAGGGQVWRNAGRLAGAAPEALQALTALEMAGVEHRAGAVLLEADLHEGGAAPVRIGWLSGPGPAGAGRAMHETQARALVLATGAMERPVLFAGATLPGVMGIGALQSVLKQSGQVPRGGVVLAGQGPLLLLTLVQVMQAGGRIDAVLDLGPPGRLAAAAPALPGGLLADPVLLSEGTRLLRQARGFGMPWHRRITELTAQGGDALAEVSFMAGGTPHRLPCRLLAIHDGVIPNTQASRLLGLDHAWREDQASFAPVTDANGRTSRQAVWVAGDGAGIGGAGIASLRGAAAGRDVVRILRGSSIANSGWPRRLAARRFVDRLYPPLPVRAHATADTIVCRCEAVTLAEVDAAIDGGATGPNRVKAFTRCGMGPCQGRMCGNVLTRLVAERTGAPAQEVGALRIRAPLKPVLIADYLGLGPDIDDAA